jgi:hypothetical protein
MRSLGRHYLHSYNGIYYGKSYACLWAAFDGKVKAAHLV